MTVRSSQFLLGAALLGGSLALASAADAPKLSAEQTDFFEKKIRPVLVQSCYSCHSAKSEKLKGGLRLDTRQSLLAGGNTGPGIIPGKPEKSLLIKSIRQDDPDLAMPPKGDKLSDAVIADFEAWVRMGAPDPREEPTSGVVAGMKVDWQKARDHWAYKAVSSPEVPKVKDAKHWVQSPIDAFVLAKLQEKGLQPSAPADKQTLIRRVTYDLTGLPPTAEEVDAFVADHSPDAFAKVVDRLLESPHYGEQWGRHWLDVARYADTSGDRQNGNRKNPLYPYAWTYRDYVIKSFNEDKPFDRFIVEQIAADKLPESKDDKTLLAALGFLTVGKTFMNNENDVIDDRIDVVTKGLMAITASCARCHDHKFDPVPTKDYYSLHGVFASSVQPKEGPLLEKPEETAEYKDFLSQVAKVEQEVEVYHDTEAARFVGGMLQNTGEYLMAVQESQNDKERSNSFRQVARKRGLDSELAEIFLDTMKTLSRKNDPVFSAWFKFSKLGSDDFASKGKALAEEIAAAPAAEVHPTIAKAFAGKSPASIKEVAAIYTEVCGRLNKEMKLPEYVPMRQAKNKTYDLKKTQVALADTDMEALREYFFSDDSPVAPDARMMQKTLGVQFANQEGGIRSKLVALEMTHPGSPVRAMSMEDAPRAKDSRIMIRGEPKNLGPVAPRQFLEILSPEKREPFKDGSGRLELAKDIANKDNPLTARVYVNRVWQQHFGEAIVRTPSDFGLRSEPPTHPELLDYLAQSFMQSGWSVKKLHRLILLTSTYQQDSKANDKAMKVDPTNQWLWRMNLRRLSFESIRDTLLVVGGNLDSAMGGRPVKISDRDSAPQQNRYVSVMMNESAQPRRTVYGMIDRSALPEMYRTFDFANPDMSSGERYLTTVPQQALFMMNSPFVVEQVKHLLAREDFKAQKTPEEKVRFLFRTTFQRQPTDKELKLSLEYLASQEQQQKPGPLEPNTRVDVNKGEVRNRTTGGKAARDRQQSMKLLEPWERLTQVVLLSNELVFVN